ncbi:MAG: farnesyl diphosphate synthase [Gemmataceae bacterium]
MKTLKAELEPKRARFEVVLRDIFERLSRNVPPILREAMEYSLFSGGKRLRPILCGLACEAVGGSFESSYPAGVALEMIHTYSLIHDDLPAMDDDDVRRGRPTSHKVYGDALAILAGDALQAMAFEVLGDCYPPMISSVMMKELSKASGALGMVGGQVLDLIADGRITQSHSHAPVDSSRGIGHLEMIHRLKTGALIRVSLLLGERASRIGGEPRKRSDDQMSFWLQEYGAAFGLLFQVTDDLLDAEGDPEAMGKKSGKDAVLGKLTYPGLLGIEASRDKARELVQTCILAAEKLGERGQMLAELARFVERRDR